MSRDIRVKLEWNIHGWTGWRRAGRGRGKRSTTSCINGLSVSDNDNHVHRAGGEKKERKRKGKKKNNNKRREKRGIAAREGKEVRGGRREGRNDAKKMGTRDITFVVSRCAVLPARYTYLRTYLELLP